MGDQTTQQLPHALPSAKATALGRRTTVPPARTRGRCSQGCRGALSLSRWIRASPQRCQRRPLRTTRERAVRARADDRNRERKRAQTGGRSRTSLDRPERGRVDPFPTGTSIRACAPCERTTGRRRPPPRNPAARYRRATGGAMVVLNQQPASSLGATTRSPCLLHGLSRESPGRRDESATNTLHRQSRRRRASTSAGIGPCTNTRA
jgi:hypothetical protein